MGFWTLKTAANDEKLFDIQDVGNKFSATEMASINTGMEKFLNDKASAFAKKMAETSNQTFDQLLDGTWLDFNLDGTLDTSEVWKEIIQYAIDNKLLWLDARSTSAQEIAKIKWDLKSLEFEITSAGYMALAAKLTAPAQKQALAKSFLLWYQENIRGWDDVEAVKAELVKSLIDVTKVSVVLNPAWAPGNITFPGSIDNIITFLKRADLLITKVEIDSTGKINQIYFNVAPNPVNNNPIVPPINNTNSGIDTWTITNPIVGTIDNTPTWGLSGGIDINCVDCLLWQTSQTIITTTPGGIPQIITDPTQWWYGTGPLPWPDDNNEDRGYDGIDTAKTNPTPNATVAYQSAQNYYVTNNNENGEDTEWDILRDGDKWARLAVRKFLLSRPRDLDIVDADEKLGKIQKKELRELKIAIMGDGMALKGIGLEEFGDVFVTMTQIFGKDGSARIDTPQFWKKFQDSNDVSTAMKNKVRENNKLALFGKHFIKRKKQEYNGKYIERFFDLINDQIVNAGQAGSFSFKDAYNKRNDNNDVILNGQTTVPEGSARKGVLNLIDMNADANASVTDIMTMIRKAGKDKVDMMKLMNLVYDQGKDKIIWGKMNETEKAIAKKLVEHNIYGGWADNDTYRMIAEALATGMDPEDVYNMKAIIKWATLDHGRFGDARTGWIITAESTFVYWLGDATIDGKVWFNDRGMISGLQMQEKFRSATTNLAYAKYNNDFVKAEKEIVANILCFANGVAKNNGDIYFHNVINQALVDSGAQKLPNGQRDVSTIDASILMNPESGFLAQHPWVFNYVHNIMSQPPIPVDAIMEYGADAFAKRHKDTKDSFNEYAKKQNITPEQLEKVNGIVDGRWKSLMKEAELAGVSKYVQWQKEHFRTQMTWIIVSMNPQALASAGVWVGWGMGFDALLANLDRSGDHTLSTGLQVGFVNGEPSLWVSLNYNGKLWWGRSLNATAGVGTSYLSGFMPIPIVWTTLAKERELNKANLVKDLEAKWYKTAHVWLSAKLIGVAPVLWVHAGVDINRLRWIEEQYKSIRLKMNGIASDLVNAKIQKPEWDALSIRKTVSANIAIVKQLLSKRFAETDSKLKESMAENLYKAFVHFGCLDAATGLEKTRAADMLAEYFALQRKNQSVEKLKWGFSWVDIGLDWVVGTTVFIPSLAVSFERYFGLRYEDAKESKMDVEMAETRGYGNRLLNPNKPTMDEAEIAYLNNMLSTAARFETYRSILEANPISLDENVMVIPKALFSNNILNVKISDTLKWKVWYDAEGDLHVPRSQTFRFADFAMSQHAAYVLNIGDDNTEDSKHFHLIMGREDALIEQKWLHASTTLAEYKAFVTTSIDANLKTDISVATVTRAFEDLRLNTVYNYSNFPRFQWHSILPDGRLTIVAPQWFTYNPALPNHWFTIPKTGLLTISETKDALGNSIYNIKHTPGTQHLEIEYQIPGDVYPLEVTTINADPDWTDIKTYSWFPLKDASAIDIASNKVTFDLVAGAQVNMPLDSHLKIENNKLIVPLTGQVSIKKETNGTYAITYTADTRLSFCYEADWATLARCEPIDLTECVNYIDDIRDTYFTLADENALSELENGQNADFHAFLANAVAVSSDANDTVDEAHIDKTIAALKTMLAKDSRNTSASELLLYINGLSPTDYQKKAYVVNKMKQIFALEDRYQGQAISKMYDRREKSFETMRKNDNMPFDNAWFKAKLWVASAGAFDRKNKNPQKDLIGFTAFYRKLDKDNLTNQWFSLLPLGDANIYGKMIQKIENTPLRNEKSLANEWFITKLSRNKIEKTQTIDCYKTKLASMWVTGLTEAQIMDLLRWKPVTHLTKTITFDFDMVAYAQWECCNQGIGLKLKEICVSDSETDQEAVAVIDANTGKLKTQKVPVKVGSVEWWRLYVNTQHTRSAATKERAEVVVWFAAKLKGGDIGGKTIKDGVLQTTPGIWENPSNPWIWTGPSTPWIWTWWSVGTAGTNAL